MSSQPGGASKRIARVRRLCLATACAGLLGLALAAGSASAHVVNLFQHTGYIDGSGSTYVDDNAETQPYFFTSFLRDAAIHQESDRLVVLDNGYVDTGIGEIFHQGIFSQFTLTGTPEPFTVGDGTNTKTNFPNYNGAIAVDNSGTASDGNVYFLTQNNIVFGYDSSGAALGGNFPLALPDSICDLEVGSTGTFWVTHRSASKVVEYDATGTPTGNEIFPDTSGGFQPCTIAIDSAGNFYLSAYNNGGTRKFDSSGALQYVVDTQRGGVAVDPTNDDVYVGRQSQIRAYTSSGELLGIFGGPEESTGFGGVFQTSGITVDADTRNIYVVNGKPYPSGIPGVSRYRVEIFHPSGPIHLPDVTTGGADFTPTAATLHGIVNPDTVDTTECYFEWGTSTAYTGGKVPCAEGQVFGGTSDQAVSAEIKNLTPGTVYNYRLVAKNGYQIPIFGGNMTVEPQGPPIIQKVFASEVNSDGVRLTGTIDPEGAATTYRFEYGTDESYGTSIPVPDASLPTETANEVVSRRIIGLIPGTTYHFRLVAENQNGTATEPDQTFNTFALYPEEIDPCPNAEVRKQTGASLLLDCRAYELASAARSGGYDVESDLIPGQEPLTAYPKAQGRVLYSLHHGTIPGIAGEPTNLGPDPYVAQRGPTGWSTSYVGLPSGGIPSDTPFGSPLAGSSSDLSAFAFGGENICSPCFVDGSGGIPVRMPDGSLVQGMRGTLNPAGATSSGYVAEPLSGDGRHLVFGSTAKFEPDGNSNGDTTIYHRDLAAGTTKVVSKTPGGATMTGPGIGQLDISANGGRILIGRLVSTAEHPGGEDADGNKYWHLYMNVGNASQTIDLTPGTTSGVLYHGMTDDGTKVFFSTPDSLVASDEDTSVDLYRADVSASGSTLTLVSTGGTGVGCDPAAGDGGPHWNSVSGDQTCDAVGFPAGTGVSSEDGTVFFLSPETLDGSATADEANLFAARPGDSPQFVATLAPDDKAVSRAVSDNDKGGYGVIQVTPSGSHGLFASTRSLTGYPNQGFSQIYRYATATDELECVSCAPTRATPTGDTTLSRYGLNISDDGRVFFTSPDPLVLRDTNEKADAYEWKDGVIELISSGSSPTASGLLSVSSDGVDAFFFTRQVLAQEDESGSAMKIYDARANGGFPVGVPIVPCQASDECHGPGTPVAPTPIIATLNGTGGQYSGADAGGPAACPGNRVRRGGRCVKPRPACRGKRVRRGGRCVKPRKKSRRGKRAVRKSRRHTTRRNG